MSVPKAKIAIIGAGWAGLSAAVALADYTDLTIFEASREAGGRARKVNLDGRILDNGQHILLGAYARSLNLIRTIGVNPADVFLRLPLVWSMYKGIYLRCAKLPAPLHLLFALLGAKGLSVTEKWRLASALQQLKSNNWQVNNDCSVDVWLRQTQQNGALRSDFWQPLVLSALNTSLEEASLLTLSQVLADSFGAVREHSDFLLPRVNLSQLMAEPALAYLAAKNVNIRTEHRVRRVHAQSGKVVLDGESFDGLIIAVAAYHLAALLDFEPELQRCISAQSFNPISTIYLQYKAKQNLNLPISGNSVGTIHWLFDKEALSGELGMLAALISCATKAQMRNRDELIKLAILDIQNMTGSNAQPFWAQVVNEHRATFSAQVNRALPKLTLQNLPATYLAGDWTHEKYPATLEGAVQSGELAAKMLLARLL